MAIPYIQLDTDFIQTKAPIISALLKAPRQLVIGMGADLIAFAVVATSTKERPPDGCFVDPDATTILEGAMGWTGDNGRAVDAFMRAGVLEKLEIGIRVRGCDRYKATWEKNNRRRKAKTGTEPEPPSPVGPSKPEKTGPQTEMKTETERKDPKDPPTRAHETPLPPEPTPLPGSEGRRSGLLAPNPDGSAWLAWHSGAYRERFRNRNYLEPESGGFRSWYATARAELAKNGQGDAELRAGYGAFLVDSHWAPKGCPWSAWLTQWAEMTNRATEAAAAPKIKRAPNGF